MNIYEDNLELRELRRKLYEEHWESKPFSVKCPFCNSIPKIIKSTEFEFIVSCTCGKLSFREKY